MTRTLYGRTIPIERPAGQYQVMLVVNDGVVDSALRTVQTTVKP